MTSAPERVTHATRLGPDWALWGPVALRAPGFPADGVDAFGSPALAAAADGLDDGGDPAAYRTLFEAESARLSEQVLALVDDRKVRMALAWQNHRIFETALAPMARNRGLGRRNSKQRAHETLIVSYWQRYCLKNDTIGFFGPSGWGHLRPDEERSRLHAGTGLIASWEAFFETWAVDRLAEALAGQPGMAQWFAPRAAPAMRQEGSTLYGPARTITLTAAEAAVLARSTGLRSARAIATELAGTDPDLASPEDVLAVVDALRTRRLLSAKLDLPMTPHPERDLRAFLDGVGDPTLRADGLDRLDRLEAARARATAAAADEDPERFVAELVALDEEFGAVTGCAPSRNSGKAYGGRTLLYHDARRDVEFTLGQDFLTALAPIDLLLQSVRWLSHELATMLRERFGAIFDRLSVQSGGRVDLATFWFEVLPVIHRAAPKIVDELGEELERRWGGVLRLPAEAGSRVQLRSEDLADAVQAAFDAPDAGWAAARYASPDLMIAAADVAAVNRGDFLIVLGELHIALPSFRHHCFVTQAPDKQELLDCVGVDYPEPQLLPVMPKESHGRLTVRTQPALVRDEDILVALFEQTTRADRPNLLKAGELAVEAGPQGPTVTVPSGHRYPVFDVFSEMLTRVIMDAFTLLPSAPHRPRITIDRLVVSREAWRFDAREMPFARRKDEADRFAAARRWWRERGLPERVFAKVPGETKPFYVDATGIISMNLLARSVRRLQDEAAGGGESWVQLTEMLPDHDGLWLTDAEGRHYTSELRVVAVDQRGRLGPT